jgi:hypothetical protein
LNEGGAREAKDVEIQSLAGAAWPGILPYPERIPRMTEITCWLCGSKFDLGDPCPKCGEVIPPKTLQAARERGSLFTGWFEIKKVSGRPYLYWRSRFMLGGRLVKVSRYIGRLNHQAESETSPLNSKTKGRP